MGSKRDGPSGWWVVAGVVAAAAIAGKAGMLVQDAARDADFEARSGDVAVTIEAYTDESVSVSASATLTTDAEHEQTVLTLSVQPERQSARAPMVRVEFSAAMLTCVTTRSWVWGSDGGLDLVCDEYIPLDRLANVGTGVVTGVAF